MPKPAKFSAKRFKQAISRKLQLPRVNSGWNLPTIIETRFEPLDPTNPGQSLFQLHSSHGLDDDISVLDDCSTPILRVRENVNTFVDVVFQMTQKNVVRLIGELAVLRLYDGQSNWYPNGMTVRTATKTVRLFPHKSRPHPLVEMRLVELFKSVGIEMDTSEVSINELFVQDPLYPEENILGHTMSLLNPSFSNKEEDTGDIEFNGQQLLATAHGQTHMTVILPPFISSIYLSGKRGGESGQRYFRPITTSTRVSLLGVNNLPLSYSKFTQLVPSMVADLNDVVASKTYSSPVNYKGAVINSDREWAIQVMKTGDYPVIVPFPSCALLRLRHTGEACVHNSTSGYHKEAREFRYEVVDLISSNA